MESWPSAVVRWAVRPAVRAVPAVPVRRSGRTVGVLVVQNDADKSLGRIADELIGSGVRLDVRSPDRDLPTLRGYAGLIVLYGFLYLLLRLEDAALLIGSLGLFVILASVMYATRRMNWYELRLGVSDR